jgi:threonine dehydrogenase-like Zn-dependent dehydrogenase
MHALVFDGPGSISFDAARPDPVLVAGNDAIVLIEGTGLCGSDLHPFLGAEPARSGIIPGHEAVGSVVATGPRVSDITVGDRVIIPFTAACGECRLCTSGLSSRCVKAVLFGWGDPDRPGVPALDGMQAQKARVPMADSTLVRIPEGFSTAQAVLLADNYPTGWYAVHRAEATPGEALVVLGAGSVGLCAVSVAVHMGIDDVTVIDPMDGRRKAASRLGATVMAPDDPQVGEIEPVGSVIDAAGTRAAQQLAADLCRPGATLSTIAVQTASAFGFGPVQAYDRNLTIRTGRAPVRSLLDEIVPLVTSGDVSTPDRVVFTDEGLPLSEGPATYRRFADRSIIKAWFDPRV